MPKKVRVFFGVGIQGKLNTNDLIQKKNLHIFLAPSSCVMRKEGLENDAHFFLYCALAQHTWARLFKIFGILWCCLNRIDEAIIQLMYGRPFKRQASFLWTNAVMAMLWRIWLERNQRILKESYSSP